MLLNVGETEGEITSCGCRVAETEQEVIRSTEDIVLSDKHLNILTFLLGWLTLANPG